MKSQIATSSSEDDNGYGGRRKLPFVFTEQGIAMLSAVLHSDVAIRVGIRIMDTFVEMRKYMANTSLLYERLNAMEVRQINYQAETDERFERVFAYISEHEESSQKVFFDGQIYSIGQKEDEPMKRSFRAEIRDEFRRNEKKHYLKKCREHVRYMIPGIFIDFINADPFRMQRLWQ